jgi:phage major head subunit gpT-like protein
MIINAQALDQAFKAFKTVYTDAVSKAQTHHDKIAMRVPSSARDETYGWLGQFPQLREWLDGDRVIKSLQAHSFTIESRKFESTVGVKREDFTDDRLGVFKLMFAEMGHLSALYPEDLNLGMLKAGFTDICFDGQFYFDTDHPVKDAAGADVVVGNLVAGTESAWNLLDASCAVRPLVWQERETYDFQQ